MYIKREDEDLMGFLNRVHHEMMRKYAEEQARYEAEHDIPVFDVKFTSEVKIR